MYHQPPVVLLPLAHPHPLLLLLLLLSQPDEVRVPPMVAPLQLTLMLSGC
jgi:hypothetical protein